MKKFIIIILVLSTLSLNSQKINYKIDAEFIGINILGVGFNADYSLKDSSKIGLRISGGYLPKIGSLNNFIISSSLNLTYNPAKLINGKFHFRLGNSYYFRQHHYLYMSGLTIIEYDYWSEQHGANLGVHYNILKKTSDFELKFGVDAFVLTDWIDFKRGLYPVFPSPSIQYGIKF